MPALKQLTILLVEDELELRRETAAFLELYFDNVLQAGHGGEALTLFAARQPDLVVSDIRMPVMDGLELAVRLKERAPDIPVLFCTAFTETTYLLKAIELGVAAFVRKPVDTDELLAAIDKAAVPVLQRREIRGLSDELTASLTAQMGKTPQQLAVAEQVARVARTPFSVLLQGETGSGKSRLANMIHTVSPRREAPFVTVQLGAIPIHLAESELFGHRKGAFTGADRDHPGLVETAQGGTLFLDDIDACPQAIQAKLLRFAELKRFTPVGGTVETMVDLRIIASSNRDLQEEVRAGRFREDLYYRLADVIIPIPPLRDSRDAIVPLALKFLRETCDALGRDLPLLDEDARRALAEADWPGNIRQLKSVLRRAAINAGSMITRNDLLAIMDAPLPSTLPATGAGAFCSPPPFPCSMDCLEKWSLEHALQFCDGKRMKTAMMLGMNYYTFRRRLAKHGIAAGEQ
jgi:DNA-binding NtrC family response regulator